MRPCHYILCRDVFIHLPNKMIINALKLFRQSGWYLISTTFPGAKNYERAYKPTIEYYPLDLSEGPFFLGKPHGYLPESYEGKFLGIWWIENGSIHFNTETQKLEKR